MGRLDGLHSQLLQWVAGYVGCGFVDKTDRTSMAQPPTRIFILILDQAVRPYLMYPGRFRPASQPGPGVRRVPNVLGYVHRAFSAPNVDSHLQHDTEQRTE